MKIKIFILSCLLVSPAYTKHLNEYIVSVNDKVHWYDALIYEDSFKKSAKEFKISPSWLAAMAQQENTFVETGDDGKTPASYGLMQLQVRTAKIIAESLGDDPNVIDGEWLNSHSEKSIRYAACHFRNMLDLFGQSYYWATRAYNGGDKRIRWAKNGSKKWKNLSVGYYNKVWKHFNEIKEYKNER